MNSCVHLDDGPEHARARREELGIPRHVARELGHSTLDAIRSGEYEHDGRTVDWFDVVEHAIDLKRSLPPESPLPEQPGAPERDLLVEVTNETTLGAARRLVVAGERPLALNFANGIEPGGGFLDGARAQEEVLCRSSALYATLEGDPMYEHHRGRELPDSTDWAILSPAVPVFRTDDGATLPEPWPLDVITCAAPFAPALGQPLAGDLLAQRIDRVLEIARAYGYAALVLGAWGCGAFGNDPDRTAGDFRSALEGPFAGAFAHVVFAIADWTPERMFLGPFRDVFAEGRDAPDLQT
jgi:uncharacterized protein (TIGR02452 family)